MRRNRRIRAASAALIAVAALTAGPTRAYATSSPPDTNPQAPPTRELSEPAGRYYYECVSPSGTSYWLKSGEPTTNCQGSYLKRYINGNLVATYHLSVGGAPGRNVNKSDLDCIIAIVGTSAAILSLNGSIVGWAVSYTHLTLPTTPYV